ncbi:dmX-like protein 2 isoform X5 [Chionomys nivalis]|uniref:dmX-like protein 2 isoform X5 n=1 Tax=Chionomys nivalis TaxID=269649 RepID=UPI0025923BC5|nr:dmX-like protein 2 isoform X5 [Chionomys nivalis]
MHLHQVLTGAVNPGDNCYSVGSVGDVPFTAYGSGCDIVILASDFECVQIIPGAKHGNIQVSCVECSNQHGRVAASYGNAVCIFEPLGINSHKRNSQLKCQWLKTGQFFLSSVTYNLAWDPQDNRLLTATDSIQLWAPPGSDILEEEEEIDSKIPPVLNDWKCVWQCKTSVSIHLMEWSPDGEYFATAGKDDCLLKVWYPMTGWKSSIIPQDHHEVKRRQASSQFSFVYLAHPRAVTGFSWRKTSKYMPRGSVCNVLLTSCHDGVCRLWAETLLPEDCLLGEQICETTTSSIASNLSHAGKHKDRIQHALETIHHLKNLRKGQRRSSVLVTHTELMPDKTATHEVQRHISHHANALCHFHIAASINPATDIPNVLVGTSFNIDDVNGGFVVHWLNNKEFHFTSSTEIFMHQLRKLSEKQLDHESDDAAREDEERSQEERERGLHMRLDHELSLDRESEAGTGSSEHEDGEREGSPRAHPGPSIPIPLPTVLLDRKIETLLTEWNKNPDMLFTIHPVDGTFLVWHVKYLDEYNPGIFRQVQVSFSSRIPVAFPSGDANSLSKNIMMYACVKATKDSHHTPPHQEPMSVDSSHGSQPHSRLHSTDMNILAPTVMMVSKHIDGSLNQWAVTFADKSAFTTVLTVSHKFRYCGHRFHLNDLACHSVLPLLLTSSHHNALLTPESDCQVNRLIDPVKHTKESSKQPLRNAATRTFHDPNAIYSELILWRVDPIGPLSYTGGVSELARINSLHTSAFSNVAWLPTLIPSYCLGTYCNSASACFVASDGKNLRLYQAVVDARKLLDELSDPETSKLIGEVFNIVSQQSTARPGCIIELDAITDQCGTNTQLLHVFQEDFIIGYKPHKEDMEKKEKETEIFFQPSQGYRPPPFSEKFFLVVIEKDSNNNSVLHMWHLHLKSVQACLAKAAEGISSDSLLSVPGQKKVDSSPETPPSVSSMPHSSSIANLQTASKLILSSRLVYSQPLDLPEAVEVIRATPSAGHLSSSSIYPVCLAPYLVVTTCSDNKVRFWKCCMETNSLCNTSDGKETYHWRRWPLMNDEGEDNSSTVSIVGRPVAVSCSYTGRLAVAYKQPVHHNGFISKEFSMHVCIFECESTGGSEWVLEQTIHLDDLVKVGSVLDSRVSVDSNLFVYSKSDAFLSKDRYLIPNIKHLVHLDWVSKEDGSHILTVGVGANIFMYGRLSGIVTDQANSKDGVAVITLPLGGSIKQGVRSRWVLLRSIDLVSSVDGTPSLPVSLSWVRDGILVVGMDCEMHVYAQWKHSVKFGDTEADSPVEEIAIQDHSAFKSTMLARKSIVEGAAITDDVFCSPTVVQDGGLFEAAHALSPTLPQYHPTQLLELMDLGKVRRAKAILSHLVKCIAGEVAIVRDPDAGEGTKRHLSRTISVSGSTAKDTVTVGKDGTRDYTEIDSIPPLPLHALLAADQDMSYRISEESTKKPQCYEAHIESQAEDQYSELFQVQEITTDDIDLEPEKRENKSKVINLSQYGPAYFGQEHARVLSSHLMHSSLPGLTRLEQMFLVALADTVATTSTELDENRDKYSGRDTLDECGLRYLLAMRLHTCLLTSLPPLYRVQLLHQGVSTCHFAWAFHSEAEEELINMIPAIQRGDPQWSELRAMGIGWWVRNVNTLRRCIEKVAKASFQRNNDALDAALFYLSMKKKAVVWGLFRSQHDEKMTTFFSHNFNEDRWRKAALKNAFSLLGKQRFEQSAAFFLLAGSLKDAIEVCLEKMEDIQLAMVIARLFESEFETSSTYISILNQKILGCQKDGSGFDCKRLHADPFLRSLAYWVMKDYTRALDTLLEQTPKEDDEQQGVSSLINLLSSAQDEDQPKLNVLLCEAVVAVYLSLLIHALATNSSNELFRLAAHPLNHRMWAAVFGGGVKLVVKPRRQSESIAAPPVPAEDIDKHRRRFNMRMLVPGRPVKDATPPPVPAERPSYREKFIPPELSMWDYFVAKPFLPLSDSGVIYDSDESVHSDDEEDDAFFSDTQIQEHQDPNSYSWALLHLTMVKLALHNIKNFFPIAGLEFSELPVTSPLGIAVIKNLENWEQILQEKMDHFEGPPPNYVNTYPTDLSVGAGPAILRNKAMLEPENTPFKSRDASALPVKRLWHFLVKQEVLQETFIRYIFTKKRKQSESVEEHVEQVKHNSAAEDCHIQVEADLGYPGGKAKVIHKESDMIMAFSINKANCNEIVLASTHDVQELDVTSLLACQSYIWIGEEYDRESKSSDDIDYRGSTTTLYQPVAAAHATSQVHPPPSLPWLGSGQTSTGATVLMKRNLHNVKRMTSHPVHQYYLTGAQDGSVRMFEWTRPQQLVCFRQAGNARVTRLYFNSQGNKCGVADGEGFLSIWQVNQTVSNPKPYMSWQCHSKATSDFAFITSSSLVATSGQSNDNRNVCLWDTLISPGNSLIHGFTCHDHGATVLQYAPKQQLLISGGRKGYICIFDIRQRQLMHTFQAHDSAIKALALDPCEEYFTTGSAEGNIKVWRLTGHGLIHSFKNEHAKQSIFRNIGAGVTQIDISQDNRLFSCGADGTLKTRVLPSAFNIPNRILDIL